MMNMLPLSEQTSMLSINRLALKDFRNYAQLSIDITHPVVVLTGDNGAGKTNILEAISLLASGRGLRNAKLSELNRATEMGMSSGHIPEGEYLPSWSVHASLYHPEYDAMTIATGYDGAGGKDKRQIRINGEASAQSELPYYMQVSYLTPVQDHIFIDGSTSRRKFLDRLASHFFADHVKHLAQFSHSKGERKKILAFAQPDDAWLSTIERRMAEQALAIIASRVEAIAILQRAMDASDTPFPTAHLSTSGELERLLLSRSALGVEEDYQRMLKDSRMQDKQSGRTLYGPHTSDFLVVHGGKKRLAQYCSTGEQKAVLLSILLAEIQAKKQWSGYAPIVLLDEVVAHLDLEKRQQFYDAIAGTGAQYWFTGTHKALFEYFGDKAQFLTVENDGVLV